MSTPRSCAANPCPRRAVPVRAGWTLAVLFLLVAPFAGFVAPASVLAHHTNIKMPFAAGATWRILQGYNGSSHQNTSSTWQYYYSLDLVRADGNTAGQRVISPVDGTIRWIDEAYGGMSINLGDGYAFAYFHTTLAPGLAAGQNVVQGQYLGTVAPPGEAGNGGTPHIHVTLWTTNDGGNWDRHATPFTGDHRINGYDFPDKGGSNQYVNTQVVSTNAEVQGAGSGSAPGLAKLVSPATGTTFRTSPTTVNLDWYAVTGATQYQVVINDGDIISPWQSHTSWTTGSLGNGQYTWQVRARNSAGTGNLTAKWVFWVDGSGGTTPTPTPGGSTSLGMKLGSTSGRVGSSVTVTGTGYGANEAVRLYIDSVATANQLVQTTANASGAWSTTITIPDATGGSHAILGRGQSTNRQVSKTFTVTSYLNRTPYQGPPGTTINLTVQGFGANETVRVTFDSTTGPLLANVTTNAKGTGTVKFPLPNATTGWHDYVGVGQTSDLVAWGALYIERLLTASPKVGAPGTTVTAKAKGFLADRSITIAWNKTAGSSGKTVCSGTTNYKGSFTCTFAIPQTGAGSYPLVATTSDGTASVNIGVTGPPSVSISPTSGPVGETITISAGGFGANETINFTWDKSTYVWQSRKADGAGSVSFPMLVPQFGTGTHTLKATGASSGKTASRSFTVVKGTPTNTSEIAPGTFAVTATEEDLIGETTSNGHRITPDDHFVALPACTQSSCPSRTPGGSQYVAACGDNCYVRVTNPANDRCSVAPVWDVGPWFTNDNWWDPANQRNLNLLKTTRNILPQGYTGADAAKDGLDVGYGLSNGVGISNVGYQVGNRAAIDLADGTWTDIGFANGQGIGQVHVTILWLTGEDHVAAAKACGQLPKEPDCNLSRSAGHVGNTVVATCTDFRSGETVDLFWDKAGTTPLASFVADSSGNGQASFRIPIAPAGAHKLIAMGRTSKTPDGSTITVQPGISFSPGSAATGASVTATGRGWAAGSTVNVYWNRTSTSTGTRICTATATSNGSFTCKFTVPSSAVGSYPVQGVAGSLTANATFRITSVSVASLDAGDGSGAAPKTQPLTSPTSTATTTTPAAAASETPAATETGTATPTVTATPTETATPTATETPNATGTATSPETPVATETASPSPTPTETAAPTETATPTETAAPTETPVPTETAVPTEARGEERSLDLSPRSGGAGTDVTVTGTGFDPGETANLYYESTDSEPIASFEVDGNGEFSGTIVIPDVDPGTLLIAAKGDVSGTKASKSFRVLSERRDRSDNTTEEPASTGEDQAQAPADAAEPTEEEIPTEEPTQEATEEAVPQDLVFLPVADTSVSGADPETTQSPDEAGVLVAGGPDGRVTFITFQVEGIGEGTVVGAQLVLTNVGDSGGATGRIGVLDAVLADEASWTYANAPVRRYPLARAGDGSAVAASLDPGSETAIDVSGSVNANGTITFVVRGTNDSTLILGSREGGAPPRLVVTVRDDGQDG